MNLYVPILEIIRATGSFGPQARNMQYVPGMLLQRIPVVCPMDWPYLFTIRASVFTVFPFPGNGRWKVGHGAGIFLDMNNQPA